MNTILKVLLVAALAAAGLYTWSATRSAPTENAPRTASTAAEADATAMEGPSRQPQAMSAAHEHRETTRQDTEARAAQARSKREAAFMAEPMSPEWSARTQQQILDALSPKALAAVGAFTPLAELSADCRSFSCRIEATYADQDEFEVAQHAMISNVAAQLPVSTTFVDRRADGTIRGTIYATANAPGPKRDAH